MIDAYPLTWPIAQPRTPSHRRTESSFKVSFGIARDALLRELKLLGAMHVVISSGVPTRIDGLPYANMREPADPGVAVYFDRRVEPRGQPGKWSPFVVACDTYNRVAHNLRAVGVTIEALRTIQRHGASSMLEQAFTGFAALPPASGELPWWGELGVREDAPADMIRTAYRTLSRIHHPDVTNGSAAAMVRINRAFEQAKAAGRA